MDKSNRYFSESIGRGRDEYETFFSQEKLLPGGKGPSENPADIGPGELFSGDDGTDQGGYYKSDFEIYADRYGSYGNRDTGDPHIAVLPDGIQNADFFHFGHLPSLHG